jgi:hypothetical protein
MQITPQDDDALHLLGRSHDRQRPKQMVHVIGSQRRFSVVHLTATVRQSYEVIYCIIDFRISGLQRPQPLLSRYRPGGEGGCAV